MKGYWKYALLTFVIFAVSWGVIIADLGDVGHTMGYRIFVLLLPMMAKAAAIIGLNFKYALPLLLLRNRVIHYCLRLSNNKSELHSKS